MQHNADPYGFRSVVSMEAIEREGVELALNESRVVINELADAANSLRTLGDSIALDGACQQDALEMESTAPGILPENVPVVSFTKMRSHTNVKVSLEALVAWQSLSLTNMLKAVYKFIMNVLRWIGDQFRKLVPGQEDGNRVAKNIGYVASAVSDIKTTTATVVSIDTERAYAKAMETAKLKVSDSMNHLSKKLVFGPGSLEMIRAFRNQIYTGAGKLETLCKKYENAIEMCTKGGEYTKEAKGIFEDLSGFNADTLVDLSQVVTFFEIGTRVKGNKASEAAAEIIAHCKGLSSRRASWDVKTSETVTGFISLSEALVELYGALEDDQLTGQIPKLSDFSNKVKNAPEDLQPALTEASKGLADSFSIMQSVITVYSLFLHSVMGLTEASWVASKGLMAEFATKGKGDCTEAKDAIVAIETKLKSALKKA